MTRRDRWYREIEGLEERRICVFDEARDVIDARENMSIIARVATFIIDLFLIRTNLINRAVGVIQSLRLHVLDLERELAAARVRIRELSETPVKIASVVHVNDVQLVEADDLDDVFYPDDSACEGLLEFEQQCNEPIVDGMIVS